MGKKFFPGGGGKKKKTGSVLWGGAKFLKFGRGDYGNKEKIQNKKPSCEVKFFKLKGILPVFSFFGRELWRARV